MKINPFLSISSTNLHHLGQAVGVSPAFFPLVEKFNKTRDNFLTLSHLMASNSNTVLSDLNSAIGTLTNFSSNLISGIEDSTILHSFNTVVDLQKSIQLHATDLQKNFTAFNNVAAQTTKTFQDITGPISSAITNLGISIVNAQDNFHAGIIDSKLFQASESISGLCLSALKDQQNTILNNLSAINEVREFKILAQNSVPAIKMISEGISELSFPNSLPAYAFDIPSLTLVQEETSATPQEIKKCQARLDEILYKIDPVLVTYRQGCWDTFLAEGKDHLGQAASSMRRLIDNLLRAVAPEKAVEKTTYFKNNKGAKSECTQKPTRKARVYYLLGYDKNEASHFQRLAKGFLETYENLSAWDHQPIDSHDFMHGVFITIEGYLFSLLTEWQKNNQN